MKVKQVQIHNFKSIRELTLEARRVNIFIGEPNTGKTNVLEALSLLSENIFAGENFRKVTRFQHLGDLFLDNDITKRIVVSADDTIFELEIAKGSTHFAGYNGLYKILDSGATSFTIGNKGEVHNLDNSYLPYGIRRYIFEKIDRFDALVKPYLNPPFGDNLPQIINNLPNLYDSISSIFQDRGFKLLLRPVENEIHLAKEVKGKLSSYPYQTISETWKRIMFLLAVLETNEDQVLLLDEPEANIFPFFNTQIAETIGAYNRNQFFITTHNPYLLQSLIEKTPKEDLCVFVTRMEDFETKVEQMDSEQLSEAIDLGASVFSNLSDLTAPV